MHRRLCVIGVIGGNKNDDQYKEAQMVGKAIVEAGHIILTSGGPEHTHHIKDAALCGAVREESQSGKPARLVGILPRDKTFKEWDRKHVNWGDDDDKKKHPYRLILETGLTSYERDPINGLTPDSLIIFDGGEGTLCDWHSPPQPESRSATTNRFNYC